VSDILIEKKTYKQVSEIYGIPIAVVFNRIKGRKTPLICKTNGQISVLINACEQLIERSLIARSRMGHPYEKNEVKLLVGEYVKNNKLIIPIKDSTPGDDWYYNSMKRHPSFRLKSQNNYRNLGRMPENRS
jgi:hypothetical protein